MTSFATDLQDILPDMRRFALSITGNPDDAADLVQDAVERALVKQESFVPGSNLKSWVFTLMRNLFISQCRKRAVARRHATEVARAEDSLVHAPSQDHGRLLREAVSALDGLSDGEREAIILFGMEELTHEEASERKSLPVGTLKSRLSRGRANLRASLGLTDAVFAS